MSFEITITPSVGGATTTFYHSGIAETGRFSLHFDPGFPINDLKRFRVPGVKGNYIVNGGEIGHNPSMLVRYIDTTPTAVEALMATDRSAWASAPQEIACNGQTYSGCFLASAKMVIKMRGDTRGNAIADIEYTWTEDNPA